jgi:hypothetical protein
MLLSFIIYRMESEINLPRATIKNIIQKHIHPVFKSSASGISQLVTELSQGI